MKRKGENSKEILNMSLTYKLDLAIATNIGTTEQTMGYKESKNI